MSRAGSIDAKDVEEATGVTRATRKRHREGSTEPSSAGGATASSSLPAIATKKNRIDPPPRPSSTESASPINDDSTENNASVDETRKKVEKLSHEEKTRGGVSSKLLTVDEEDHKDDAASVDMEGSMHEREVETGQKRKMLARAESANVVQGESAKRIKEVELEDPPHTASTVDMEESTTDPVKEPVVEPTVPPPTVSTPVKKPQATFGSFSSAASPFASAKPTTSALSGGSIGSSLSSDISAKVREANNLSSTPSKPESPSTPKPAKKPQATFGAFSSTASPFSAVKSSSAFASQPVASSSNASTGNALSSFKSTVTSSSAFGGWSSGGTVSSPFATPKKAPAATADKPDSKDEDEGGSETVEADKPQASFGDILSKKDSGPAEEKTKVDLAEQEAHTGEEDEDTVYQVRCKLHVMDESNAWRERGTGSLRVNVDKKNKTSAPRLVMRAEGVLRLILNVAMFPGMSIEVTDKYVRTVVFEDGQSRSLLIRTASSKMALELQGKLLQHVPKANGKDAPEGETRATPVVAEGDKAVVDKVADKAAESV